MTLNGINGNGNACPPICAPGVLGAAGGMITADGSVLLDSLYNKVTRRIRAARTIFGDNVKLSMRQQEQDWWSLLQLPYCLVVPTLARPRVVPMDQEPDTLINPRSVTLICQFDSFGSEAEHLAANAIDIAEKQLIGALCTWRPQGNYKPTNYAGMKIMGAIAPDVKVSFVFIFYEELALGVTEEIGDDFELAVIDAFTVRVGAPSDVCCEDAIDPCAPVPPFNIVSKGTCR